MGPVRKCVSPCNQQFIDLLVVLRQSFAWGGGGGVLVYLHFRIAEQSFLHETHAPPWVHRSSLMKEDSWAVLFVGEPDEPGGRPFP